MISSVMQTQLVVVVNLKCLLCVFSRLRPYSTKRFTTGKFISGSPPKKSTSRLTRFPLFSTSQSSAALPTS